MHRFFLALPLFAALLGLLPLTPAQAAAKSSAQPSAIEPSSYWHLDYGEEKCRLARVFGDGDNRHLLSIDQGAPGERFSLTISGPSLTSLRRTNRRVGLRLGKAEPYGINALRYYWGETEGVGKALIVTSLSLADLVAEAEEESEEESEEEGEPLSLIDASKAALASTLALTDGKKDRLVLATGSLGPAFDALNGCALDLLRDWGLDPDEQLQMTRAARWLNVEQIARKIQRNYPASALRKGEQGFFRIRVIVEADGSVSDCRIFAATLNDRLKSLGCEYLEEARFEPALDENGAPMRSFYATQIIYRSKRRA